MEAVEGVAGPVAVAGTETPADVGSAVPVTVAAVVAAEAGVESRRRCWPEVLTKRPGEKLQTIQQDARSRSAPWPLARARKGFTLHEPFWRHWARFLWELEKSRWQHMTQG